eukprot:g1182.t1
MESWNSEYVAQCSALEEGTATVKGSTETADEKDTIWRKLSRSFMKTWDMVENNVAGFFGLNESKYQWAIDEYNYQKTQELLDSFGEEDIEQEPIPRKVNSAAFKLHC